MRAVWKQRPAAAAGTQQRLRSERAVYLFLCSVILVLMVGHTSNHLWSGLDFWVWLGPVREFAARPFNPSHPLVATHADDLYMGPYGFILGLIARFTGVDAFTVLAWAGIGNLVLLLAGLRYLSRCLSQYPWTAHFLLAFTLLAWGWAPWRWSGYPNLNSLGTVLPLGSTAAYGLSLFMLGLWWSWLKGGSRWHLVRAVLLFVIVLLTHQMTALWSGLIAVGFLIPMSHELKGSRWRDLLFASSGGLLLVWSWPYYSLLSAFGELGGFDGINAATYRYVLRRAVLALPGIVLLLWGVRSRKDAHLAIALGLVLSVFMVGWLTDSGSLGRVLPGIMLVAHITMADWAAGMLGAGVRPRVKRRWVTLGVTGILVLGLVGTAPGWLRSVPRGFAPESLETKLRLKSYVDPNRGFAAVLGPDDIVVAAPRVAVAIGGYAAKVTSVGIPQPYIPDLGERITDAEALLDPLTPSSQRARLMAKYDPDWLVVDSSIADELLQQLPRAMVSATVNGHAVIRVQR